jgi:hypothetical protein
MLWDLSQPRQLRSHHARSARHQATADIDALAARGLAYEHLALPTSTSPWNTCTASGEPR